MKALTLTQPWATLVALGHKRYETRSWGTEYRGELAIHAAKTFPPHARDLATGAAAVRKLLAGAPLPLGVVLCVVRLVNVFPAHRVPVDEVEFMLGDYSKGRFAWQLELVEVFDQPIPARGALGLWEWKGVGR